MYGDDLEELANLASSRPTARLELIGTPTLYVGNVTVSIPDKAYFIAAILALTPGRRLIRSQLRDLLWSAAETTQANANLRQLLSRLVRAQRVAGFRMIAVEGDWVRLLDGAVAIDLVEWLDADPAGLARRQEWPMLAGLLCRYDKDLLEGIRTGETSLDDWLTVERERLRFAWISAATAALDAEAVEPGHAIAIATRLVARDNTHEAGYRGMIRAHTAVGDHTAARRAYETCRMVLKMELGVEPSRLTVAMAERYIVAAPRSSAVPAASAPSHDIRGRMPSGVDRPRIAILPPASGFERWAQSRAYALLEDVTVGLSRYRSFRIIAAHTSLRHGAKPRLPGRDKPWCDFALFASGHTQGDELRLILRLTDARTDEVIWVSEVSVPRDDLRSVYREITGRVVAWTADAIDRAKLALPETPNDASAYRLYLEGRRLLQSTDLKDVRRARRVFRDAAKIDDSFAATYAGLSRTMSLEWLVRGAPNPDLLEEATQLATLAIERDPEDARGYREAGFANLYRKQHKESLAFFRQAVTLNPNDADLLADYADALAHAGSPKQGLEEIGRALQLNPMAPDYYHWVHGSIYYQMGHYQQALEALEPVSQRAATARLLAASAAKAGDWATAKHYAKAVRDTFPDFRTDQLWAIVPNANSEDTRNLIDGLRAAGLP